MYRDLLQGQPVEVETILGDIVAEGCKAGIRTPCWTPPPSVCASKTLASPGKRSNRALARLGGPVADIPVGGQVTESAQVEDWALPLAGPG
jgi:hypothetical protein